METRILGNVSIHGSVRLAQNESGFPANPQIGTIIVKDQCIYAYIKIGGLETWYPFASKTNSYVHVQGLPALVWNINHGLGTMDVWSQVKDDYGNIVQTLVTAVDADNATIAFTTPITGTAVIVAPDTIDVPEVKATAINVANGSVIIDSSGVRVDGSYVLTAANIEQYAQAAVQAEADARTAADTTLQNSINAEATARVNADTALQNTINANIDQSVKTTATPQFAGVKLTGHIVPVTDITYDLGTATKRFRDLYLSGSTIHLGDGKISYNSTSNEFNLLNPQSQPAKVSLSANSTDDLAEGTTHLYYTAARAQALVDVEAIARQSADAALQTLIGTKEDALGFTPENSANRGIAGGYAALGADGKIPATQLPSYVDDVLEYTNLSGFPTTGEAAKIYVALDTNKTYRWSGTAYVQITSGAVDSVAGKSGVVTLDKSDVGLSAVDNTADNIKSVLSASRLTTARTIGGTSFDGQSNIDISYTNLIDKPTLGTAASKDTPTSGNATTSQVVLGNDTRLSDARTPTAHDQDWSTITSTPTTLAGYGITDAQAADADLTAIAGLNGNTGFLKKTAANTWSLDTNTYLTANQSITVSGDASGTGSTAIALTLATITDSGTGSFKKINVDGKGRVTGTTAVTASDITGLSGLLSSTAGSALAPSGSSGSSTTIARADHVHPYPTPANIGAQSSNATLTSITGLSTSATGLIKLTAGTASLDTNTYLTANQSITVSGDVSGTGSTTIALTLANSGVVAGTYNNSATAITPLTIDAKGRVTGTGSAVTITPAWSSVTGKPTTLAGYGITDAATINSPEFTGTPVAPTASAGTNTTQIATTAFVSTAVTTADNALQTLINGKQDSLGFTPENSANRGVANGYAALGSDGKVPAAQLPSYVDDVLEYTNSTGFPATGETSKIYIALDTNKIYRWSGTTYIEISPTAGNSDTATKLLTQRTISASGDGTWSVTFDGSSDVTANLALSASGVTAGTYNNSATAITPVTIDAKGRVTNTGTPVTITPAWSSVTGKPTTLSGYGITDAQAADADLTAIAGLSGNTGFLKKTAANTWSLDTNTYLTTNQSITVSGDASGTGSTTIALTLANSGVTAGTYNNSATAVTPLTVDAKGRVTSAGSAVTITPAWSNITSKPTTLSGYGITDAAAINSPEFTGTPVAPTASAGTNTTQIATTAFVSTAVTNAVTSGTTSYANGDISSGTLTTSTTASGQVVDQNAIATYRSVKYTVQVKSGTAYQLSELLVLHDGTTAYISEFGNIQTGDVLAAFDADISGGNLRLLVTPVNAITVIKVIKTLIDI